MPPSRQRSIVAPNPSAPASPSRRPTAWTTSLVLLMFQTSLRLLAPADRILDIRAKIVKDPEVADMRWISTCRCSAGRGRSIRFRGSTDLTGLHGTPPAQGRAITAQFAKAFATLDRSRFATGGTNYGNRMIARQDDPSRSPARRRLLIALQGATNEPRIDAAIGYLQNGRRQNARPRTFTAMVSIGLDLHAGGFRTCELFPVFGCEDFPESQLAMETTARTSGRRALRLARFPHVSRLPNAANVNPFRLTDRPTSLRGTSTRNPRAN